MELERLKGEKSVADNIMATDRNFTKVKLDVEEVNQQLNEKVDKANIIQTVEVNESEKIPSSVVTYALNMAIRGINARFGNIAVTNLDSIDSAFLIRFIDTSTSNKPTEADSMLIHVANVGYQAQLVFTLGTNTIYHRTKYGTWKPWKKITSA